MLPVKALMVLNENLFRILQPLEKKQSMPFYLIFCGIESKSMYQLNLSLLFSSSTQWAYVIGALSLQKPIYQAMCSCPFCSISAESGKLNKVVKWKTITSRFW